MRLLVLPLSALALLGQTPQAKKPAFFVGTGEPTAKRELSPGARFALRPPAEHALSRPSQLELAVLDLRRDPPLTGVHRGLEEQTLSHGTWQDLPDGNRVWRLSLRSTGSLGVRLLFSDFSIGEGKLWVRGDSGEAQGPYTGRGLFDDGMFWSASVPGESITIEYQPAPDASESLPFRVSKLSHQARAITPASAPDTVAATLGPLAAVEPDPAGGCNLDSNCYPDWTDSSKMVGHIIFETPEGQASCSGVLLATRNNTFKPYFLTADHCVSDETTARSVETFWTYQTPTCNADHPTEKGSVKSTGANLLVAGGFGGGDYSLLKLTSVPSGVLFAGWDPGETTLGGYVVGIHHPRGSHKRIAFGNRINGSNIDVEGDVAIDAFFYLVQWAKGITEPGSSGSPMFTSPGIVSGMLSFGLVSDDSCSLPARLAGYGRFSVAYPAMRAWLEDLPFTEVKVAVNSLSFRGANGVIAAPASQTVTVTTASTGAVRYNVRADAPWIKVSAPTGTTSATAPGTFTVSVDGKMLNQPKTVSSTITVTSGSAPPVYVNVSVEMRRDKSNVVATVVPSPVTWKDDEDGGHWPFTIRLEEKNGAPARITTLKIDTVDYSSKIVEWFGSNQVAASKVVEAALKMRNLYTPVDVYIEIGGTDDSGEGWYRTVAVPFL